MQHSHKPHLVDGAHNGALHGGYAARDTHDHSGSVPVQSRSRLVHCRKGQTGRGQGGSATPRTGMRGQAGGKLPALMAPSKVPQQAVHRIFFRPSCSIRGILLQLPHSLKMTAGLATSSTASDRRLR